MPGLFASPQRRAPRWRRPRPQPWTTALLAFASTLLLSTLPSLAYAQAQPPNRFFGSVKINGNNAADGTVVEAYIGNTLCGSGTVQNRNNAEIYLVDVVGASQKPGCAKDGDTVKFKVANLDAKETGKYATAEATRLDLTASGTARNPSVPTVLAPGQGGAPLTPIATPNPTQEATPTEAPVSPAATATPSPAGTPAATETTTPAAGETPAASATASPVASETGAPTATATGTAALISPAGRPAPRQPAASRANWLIAGALLLLAAGLAVLLYQRRRGA